MKLTYFLCLGCCKFKNITCWNTSILIISIYFSLNRYIYIFVSTDLKVYLQCIFLSCFYFSILFVLLPSTEISIILKVVLLCFLIPPNRLYLWQPYHYCAHILGDFTISPFLYPSSLQHALGSQLLCFLFRRLPWAPGDISPVATES